jgi:hypothetical protein
MAKPAAAIGGFQLGLANNVPVHLAALSGIVHNNRRDLPNRGSPQGHGWFLNEGKLGKFSRPVRMSQTYSESEILPFSCGC